MNHFDPLSLRLFVAICEEQSLTEAAHRENLTVSAVSKRLGMLEEEIGAPLLDRGRGGVQLTAAGEALLPAARGLLQSMARIRANLSEYSQRAPGQVRVAVTPSMISSFLPQDIAAFRAEYPEVNIRLDERMATDVVRSVEDGHADLGVCWDLTGTRQLQWVPYRTDRLVVAVHRQHVLARHERLGFLDTLSYDRVTVDAASMVQHILQRAAIAEGKALRTSVCVRNYDAALRVVAADLGLAIVPGEASATLIQAFGLKAIPLDEDWATRRFVVCMRDRAQLTVPARRLLESLGSHWNGLPAAAT